ncbi:enoyl-CoA hydratase/isomerase family protein [Mycobacterium sp. pUA109]|uniref:enoyl-CoA hydratase/isomerase family protein n=1 Tax=Mycobacterium sp. pUA109 TaxID=3238982 RepID=UPI00351B367A
MSTVLHTITDGVGRIALNRPGQMNAITVALGRELERAILDLGNDPRANVVLIRGLGGNFCAGGDFNEVQRLRSDGPDELRSLFIAFRRACEAIANVDVPVVAAVEGVAMAGGFELMQSADVVLVSDDARIADNHINFGMIPGGGSTQRMPRLVGRQQALGILLSGDRMSGQEAVRYGLAYRSFAPSEFNEGVEQFVSRLAGRQRSAVTTIKRLVYAGLGRSLAVGLNDESDAVVAHISGQTGERAINAFAEKGES